MSYERITTEEKFDGKVRDSHEVRYLIAGQFVKDGDKVLDACCGVGYGEKFLAHSPGIEYVCCDKDIGDEGMPTGLNAIKINFEKADQLYKEALDLIGDFDVFVGLEAIEHFDDKGVANFVELAKKSRKYIIISTPIILNGNPYHKQQFTKLDIDRLFLDNTWSLEHYMTQNDTYGIFIFKRNKND